MLYTKLVSEQNTTNEKVCFGLRENTFKQRYNGNKNIQARQAPHQHRPFQIWNLKDNHKAYKIEWSIAAQTEACIYCNEPERCNLCLSAKLSVISSASNPSVLSKRTKLISNTAENRFSLSNFNRR